MMFHIIDMISRPRIVTRQRFNTPHVLFFPSQLNSYAIAEGKALKVNVSHPKTRLFIGNIPKSKSEAEIKTEFSTLSGNPWPTHHNFPTSPTCYYTKRRPPVPSFLPPSLPSILPPPHLINLYPQQYSLSRTLSSYQLQLLSPCS